MLQPDVDGITVAARDDVGVEVMNLQMQQQSLQARLGAADAAVVDLQASIDRLINLCNDFSKWHD